MRFAETTIRGQRLDRYPDPVIRSHYGRLHQTVRSRSPHPSDRGGEQQHVHDYGVDKSIQNLPRLRNALSAINDNYLNVQQSLDPRELSSSGQKWLARVTPFFT